MKRKSIVIKTLALTSALIVILLASPLAYATSSIAYVYLAPQSIIGTEYVPCTEFTISLVVENVSELKVLSLNLSYAPRILSYRGHVIAHAEQINSAQFAAFDENGVFFLNVSFGNGLTFVGPSQIANITFHVLKRGETTLNLTVIQIMDASGNSISYETINGYFSNLSPYDANKDGRIDIEDVALVAYSLGSYPGHPRWNPDADVNQDGVIDIIDVTLVAAHFGQY